MRIREVDSPKTTGDNANLSAYVIIQLLLGR